MGSAEVKRAADEMSDARQTPNLLLLSIDDALPLLLPSIHSEAKIEHTAVKALFAELILDKLLLHIHTLRPQRLEEQKKRTKRSSITVFFFVVVFLSFPPHPRYTLLQNRRKSLDHGRAFSSKIRRGGLRACEAKKGSREGRQKRGESLPLRCALGHYRRQLVAVPLPTKEARQTCSRLRQIRARMTVLGELVSGK